MSKVSNWCAGLLAIVTLINSCAGSACVPPAFNRVAKEYNIPADIFYAIALAESGHSTQIYGFKVWPWALNIEKQSYYPESKQAALELIDLAIKKGSNQFDVGLMQVSWRFHKSTFNANAEYALDVAANLRAGAKIFSEFLSQADEVWQAVGFYNAGASQRPSSLKAASRYRERVKRIYNKHIKEVCNASLLVAS